ncbi:nucleotide exchange factor GrpE [Haloarcula litorea]|uniref:nucleotide exchange factor GrpE n=1 Tax=Haloarcula litorea TaxID=3032579 RepID=UPI0023E841E6|nr:nucleotide exchange factor GrpE [Halomicroarcula sp. GDY20]
MTEQDAADDERGDAAEGEAVDVEEVPEGVDPDAVDLDDVAAAGTDLDDVEADPDDDLVERVAESDPEEIAREVAGLRTRTAGLEGQVRSLADELAEAEATAEELEEKLKRKQAEFQNYKKRMDERREQEKQRATEDLVTRLLDVRDNLQRALEQDEDAEIRSGVESTLRQLDDVLAAENVEVIEPASGDEVDPTQHQVLARVESDAEPGTIADVHRPGYEMADKVLREAQVTVSEE